ncbi:Bifunctional DNA primase/polymerase, N-terminal [Streptomyces sp. 1222.5]|uniref:bifunctional DNA primase/polymerase n=1 Tax=unclassified Streptomyces TaxID=2593676 RepID=UPI000899825E|nr:MULTISPECIES: bifunctional DNA primase/polymerase [unclassified Streptomyces]PKW05586.1 bifunctional DNA primase/polymerase-like protein [Streptomyces sp. 5112.2]SED34852.1 Bifunctional DNA primase/polymerase, N-terminal [Streptomyces sp. 1222.5]
MPEPPSILTADLSCLPLLAAALTAAERGWPVIPLRPNGKRPAGHAEEYCPGNGRCADGHKTPEQRATTDPNLIHAAWAHQPYNVGIATGPAGLLVIDLDPVKPEEPKGAPDGATSLAALCERTGQVLPATYRVRTARGEHLYFTAPAGVRLKCSANRLGPHIDTRAWGGYVVAPGSTTPAGTYEVADDAPVAPLPEWLAALLAEPARPATVIPVQPRDGTRAARTALERECAVIAAAGEGGPDGRNNTLHKGACKVARFVAWGDLPREVAEQAIQGAGEATGLPPAECRTTIRSAMDWVIAHATPRKAA